MKFKGDSKGFRGLGFRGSGFYGFWGLGLRVWGLGLGV